MVHTAFLRNTPLDMPDEPQPHRYFVVKSTNTSPWWIPGSKEARCPTTLFVSLISFGVCLGLAGLGLINMVLQPSYVWLWGFGLPVVLSIMYGSWYLNLRAATVLVTTP